MASGLSGSVWLPCVAVEAAACSLAGTGGAAVAGPGILTLPQSMAPAPTVQRE